MHLLVQNSFESVQRLRLGSARNILGSKHLLIFERFPASNPKPMPMIIMLKCLLGCNISLNPDL